MDADDQLVHEQLSQESMGRTNRIRVSLGEINIEIESASSPIITQRPVQRSRLASSPPDIIGRTGRRHDMGREIPSTPGSSPVHFKTESLRTQTEDPVVEEDAVMEEEPIVDEDLIVEENPVMEEAPVVEEDMDLREPELNGLGISAFGPDTQALFGEEELEIPDLEFASSPAPPQHPSRSHVLDDWVAKKAERYDVPEDLVWWTLERTSGRQKLAVKTLKYFRKNNGNPLDSHNLTEISYSRVGGGVDSRGGR